MIGIVVVAHGRGHTFMAPGYSHLMDAEEWDAVANVLRPARSVEVLDLTGDPDGGARRHDLLHAVLTHADPPW